MTAAVILYKEQVVVLAMFHLIIAKHFLNNISKVLQNTAKLNYKDAQIALMIPILAIPVH